jgi:hypothetical protein
LLFRGRILSAPALVSVGTLLINMKQDSKRKY